MRGDLSPSSWILPGSEPGRDTSAAASRASARWFWRSGRATDARAHLVCIPYAGADAHVYRGWLDAVPAVEVCGVHLPGRGIRFREPPSRRVDALVAELLDATLELADRRVMLFGHSMGALIAFELARALEARGVVVAHLFASGCPPPSRMQTPRRPLHELPDDEFVAALRDLGGTPEAVLEHEELLSLFLPSLRADFEVCETYRYQPTPQLSCPLTSLVGEGDSTTPIDAARAWHSCTTGAFSFQVIGSGHFFIREAEQDVLELIRGVAADVVSIA